MGCLWLPNQDTGKPSLQVTKARTSGSATGDVVCVCVGGEGVPVTQDSTHRVELATPTALAKGHDGTGAPKAWGKGGLSAA